MSEELDKICCEFVGLEPNGGHRFDNGGEEEQGWCVRCYFPEWHSKHEFPSVSTDGNAMLRLMNALLAKGLYVSITSGTPKKLFTAYVTDNCDESGMQDHESASMALALAVAEFAQMERTSSDVTSASPIDAPESKA